MSSDTTYTPDLGMYTDAGNRALAKALLDALNVPAHQFPDPWNDDVCDWFEVWLRNHPVHSKVLGGRHSEWNDSDVMDHIAWILEKPERGVKYLTQHSF